MAKVCDLHMHSYYSDGRISPKEVVKLAKRRGVKIMALTDHNTAKGFKEAFEEGKKLGIRVIPGIEVVAKEDEVLGYFIDVENKKFEKLLMETRKRIETKVKKKCMNMARKGFSINFAEIRKRFPNARGNINDFYPYYLLILKGYGRTFSDIGKLLKGAGVKKVKGRYFSIIRVIRTIKRAGGVPVLAHPWADDKSERLLQEQNFKKLVKAGLKGIEIDNGDRDERRNKKVLRKIRYLAKKFNLIITSGSDFHGEDLQNDRTHKIGTHNCDEKVVKMLSEAIE